MEEPSRVWCSLTEFPRRFSSSTSHSPPAHLSAAEERDGCQHWIHWQAYISEFGIEFRTQPPPLSILDKNNCLAQKCLASAVFFGPHLALIDCTGSGRDLLPRLSHSYTLHAADVRSVVTHHDCHNPYYYVMLASLLLAHTTSAVTKLYLPKRVQIKPRCDWNEGFNLQGCSATTVFWNIHTHMHTFRGNKISKVIFIQIFDISNSDTGVLKDLLKWFYSISTVSERSVHLFSPFSRPSVEPRKFSFFCSGFYLKTNV